MTALVVWMFAAVGTAELVDLSPRVAANEAAVVVIVGTRIDTGASVQSSGCVVAPRGLVLTTGHQIEGVGNLVAHSADGSQRSLRVVAIDAPGEIALLQADAPFATAVSLRVDPPLNSGEPIFSIAAPENLSFTTVTGTISSTRRTYRDYSVVQADLRASPGSSGAPVFDRQGRLTGLIIGKLREEDWITIVNPIENALPLLRAHGVNVPEPASAGQAALPEAAYTGAQRDAVARYNQAIAAEDPAAKRAHYEAALGLWPEFYEGWFNLGVTLGATGEAAMAELAYRKAADLQPEALAPLRNLGRLYLRGQKPEAAAAAFSTALELAPDDPQSYNDLGEAQRQAGALAEAAANFEAALARAPEYAAAHYNLGLTRAAQGDTSGAIAALERYLSLAPGATDSETVRQWIAELAGSAAGAKP